MIHAADNGIGADGAKELAKTLGTNKTLTQIDLMGQHEGPERARAGGAERRGV